MRTSSRSAALPRKVRHRRDHSAQHENMHGRRWPFVTWGIIALNTILFLATYRTIERESSAIGEIREHIVLLAAAHPDTPMTAAEQNLVESFVIPKRKPGIWSPRPITRPSVIGM